MIKLVLIAIFLLFAPQVFATSEQAYQDYLYQFDVYRQKISDFDRVKNEYEKFKTLTSRDQAVTKAKDVLAQQDILLTTYNYVLTERFLEDRELTQDVKQSAVNSLQGDIRFLSDHKNSLDAISSPEEVNASYAAFNKQYLPIQVNMRKAAINIMLGSIIIYEKELETLLKNIDAILKQNNDALPTQKQALIQKWLQQIEAKQSDYKKQLEIIANLNKFNSVYSEDNVNETYENIKKQFSKAKELLLEVVSYTRELLYVLKYKD